MAQNSQKNYFLKLFWVSIGHLVFVTFIDFITLVRKVFVVRILGQKKNLDINPYESLNFFFLQEIEFWIFFRTW